MRQAKLGAGLGSLRRLLLGWVVSAFGVGGCDQLPDLSSLPATVVAAGKGTGSRSAPQAVVPSRPPPATHEFIISDERYLGDVARQLGVTVDRLMADNQLTSTDLHPGMVLKVHTSRDLIDAYAERQERIAAARVAAVEAKRLAKIKAEADARAARKLARTKAREARAQARHHHDKPTRRAVASGNR